VPPAPAAGPASSTGPATPPAGDAAREQDGRPRVLVAEDPKVNQRVTPRMLGRLVCAADVVESGLEVLAAIERTPYAAVLMDCQMPMMDGFEARTEIRHRERHEAVAGNAAHLPIIALTANAPESDRQRCLGVGMDNFLPKPLRTDRLAAALKQWAASRSPPMRLPPTRSTGRRTPHGSRRRAASGTTGRRPPRTPARRATPPARSIRRPSRGYAPSSWASSPSWWTCSWRRPPQQIETIRTAVQTGSFALPWRAAHTLKGDAATWGATALEQGCAEVEQSPPADLPTTFDEQLAALERELDRVGAALHELGSKERHTV